ncbi:MAG: hypothetical protein IPJ23_08150 [Ignavibacteriales bacterium]|nr:hypothetical protein [Ignavibacteriales bacterium]
MKKFLVFSTLAIIFNGCLRSYYPVAYQSSAPATAIQVKNSAHNYSNYINANATIGKGEYDQEKFNLIKLSYVVAKTGDHYNFNLEGFGQGGTYNVVGVGELYDGNKSFYGLGGDVSAFLNFKINNLKLGAGGIIGIGVEQGEYYDFRKSATKDEVIDGQDNYVVGMANVFPFISYQFSESTILSTQLNVGLPNGFSPIIQLNNEHFTLWLNWTPQKLTTDIVTTQRITIGLMIGIGGSDIMF